MVRLISESSSTLSTTVSVDHSNVQGIIQGQLDTPLNDIGRSESARLAEALANVQFDEAYTSPLSRAHEVGRVATLSKLRLICQTASIVMAKHSDTRLLPDPLLMERGLGSLEGRRRKRGEDLPDDVETPEQ
jgi:probable phosphoglycerate mutase